jgi:DNA-binding IclR family transcriptional regulator
MDKTFLKGLVLLESLARSEKPCGVTELANELQLTKSNIHRLLQGLVHQGFARNVADSGRYELTMKLWELGSHVFGRLDVRHISVPYMEALAKETSETVHLSTLDGIDVLYLAKIDSPQPVRAYTTVGGRAPAQCVATGKAQLAWADPSIIAAVKKTLKAYTSKSITKAGQLDTELERVRTQGFALNQGEWREQVCGAAAPIRDASGRVIAALGISGPAERLKPRVMQNIAPTISKAGDTISSLLGYRPPV